MGFKAIEVTPLSPTGPTVLIPTSKEECLKLFSFARTDTASRVAVVIPADASVTSVFVYGSTATDSATSSTATFTLTNNSGTVSTGTFDAKNNGATNTAVNMSNLPNLEPLPLLGDLKLSVIYAEVGASTTGGPWKVLVRYVR